jgi:hypothetical protein
MVLRKCAHQECECEIELGGTNFCSTYCEQAAKVVSGGTASGGCGCGDAGCSDERLRLEDEDVEQHA